MNMTLDGICDHTAMNADDETHQHYTDLLRSADTIIYGRITYLLMEDYWPLVMKEPTGNRSTDEFAAVMDKIGKLVFSHTLKHVKWENARIAEGSVKEEIETLRQQPGRDILVGSPGLIVAAMNLQLVDELQICVHPRIMAKGLSLFKNIDQKTDLTPEKTRLFKNGAMLFYYKVEK